MSAFRSAKPQIRNDSRWRYKTRAYEIVGALTQDFHAETAHVLFEGGFAHDETDPNWRVFDVGQDGRFLMLEALGVSAAPSIVVMQHWEQQLKRVLP